MSDPDDGKLSQAQYYDRIRDQIQHEDELVNLRVVWQLLAQSFFFSTYASLLTVKGEAKNLLYGVEQDVLLWLVPIAALLAGILTCLSVFTSLANVNHLRNRYHSYAASRKEDQTAQLFPPIQAPDRIRKLAQLTPIGLPLFILAWAIVFIRLIVAGHVLHGLTRGIGG
jgi:hypothetical protein